MLFAYSTELSDFKKIMFLVVIIALGNLVFEIYDRKFDIWIVTNKRVVDEWGVFSRNAKESPLGKINNVSCRQSIIGRLLGYGDVQIQTAAEQGATVNKFVNSPERLKTVIFDVQEKYKANRDNDRITTAPTETIIEERTA